MASVLSSLLSIHAIGDMTPSSPLEGKIQGQVSSELRLVQGTGSGQADRVIHVSGTLAGSATQTYDLLAAGGLKDILGQAVDADELKVLVIQCHTGSIAFEGQAGANDLACFKASGDGILLPAGGVAAFSLGPVGQNVTANSRFQVRDTSTTGATYTLHIVVAQ